MSRPLYLVRFPNDGGPRANHYGIAFHGPPVLRKKTTGFIEWDNCGQLLTPAQYHSIFQGLRLRPGEGPVEFTARATRTPGQ